jgi:hypothetical protein
MRRRAVTVLALGAAGAAALVWYQRRQVAAASSGASDGGSSLGPIEQQPYFQPWGPLDYLEFTTQADNNGWFVTAWPFAGVHQGETAVRFTGADFAALANAHQLPMTAGAVQASGSNQYVYVLAQAITGDTRVVETQPHTMTRIESIANAVYSAGDAAADKLGLPTLAGIEDWLKGIGRDVLVGVAVTAIVGVLVHKALKD